MSDPVKFYGAFIVSTEPIDLGKLGDNPAVTHLINEEFELGSNGRGGWVIEKSVPHHCNRNPRESFFGIGESVSVAITDWLHTLVSSMLYCSLQRKREGE